MLNHKLLDEISGKISDLASKGPAKDIEKNARAMLQGLFSRLDLVTREEFDVQQEVLLRTREKLTQMEARVAEIEAALERDKTER
jgi:BMFP domain-containing protein YqiC